jgi:hypothetical protein
MPENFSSFKRPEPKIVGAVSEEKHSEIVRSLQDRFEHNREQLPKKSLEKLRMLEYPKKDFEKTAIADINKALNEILANFKIKPFDIPRDNIYIVPREIYKEADDGGGDSPAFSTHDKQVIIINGEEVDHPLWRVAVLMHEMTHIKNFLSIGMQNDGESDFRRIGLQMHTTEKKSEQTDVARYFRGLNEAVVSELEKRLFSKIISQNPFLQKEIAERNSDEGKSLIKKAASKRRIAEDEIIYVKQLDTPDDIESVAFPYREQRRVLHYIIDALCAKDPEHFPSRDDAFQLFLQGHFSGQVLPLARSITKVFGEDAFRILGMMSEKDDESCHMTLEYLQKKSGYRAKMESTGTQKNSGRTDQV